MNDEEIKYAVNYYKDEKKGKAFSILLNLAQLYLSIAGKMPEEKEQKIFPDGARNLTGYDNGYNQARQECILAQMKNIPTVEELQEILAICPSPWIEDKAEAIHARMIGGK